MFTSCQLAPVYDAQRVTELFGLSYSSEKITVLGPPPEPVEGFVTFFDPGLSVLALRGLLECKGGIACEKGRYDYDREPFAKLQEQPRYNQVRMEPLPKTFGKLFLEQEALFPDGEKLPLPSSRAVVAALVVHYLGSQRRMLEDCSVRTADMASDGHRVCVGYFRANGFHFYPIGDLDRFGTLGLFSAPKC